MELTSLLSLPMIVIGIALLAWSYRHPPSRTVSNSSHC